MRTPRWFSIILMAPLYGLLLVALGCGGGSPPSGKTGGTTPPPGTAAPSGDKTPVDAKSFTTLRGKVTYDGELPSQDATNAKIDEQVKIHPDSVHCHKDESKDSYSSRAWRVGKDGGVANVVIFVRPPVGKYFKLTKDQMEALPKEVKVDQPFCAFEPYVSVACPKYYDGDKKMMVDSGQVVKVLNSAAVSHNTKWAGDTRAVAGGSETLQPKKEGSPSEERQMKLGTSNTVPVQLNCDFHKWMQAYIWALDTPFAAVTNKDGTFEIKNVPAGTEVQVIAWHEGPGFFLSGKAAGDKMTLKENEHELNLKVK